MSTPVPLISPPISWISLPDVESSKLFLFLNCCDIGMLLPSLWVLLPLTTLALLNECYINHRRVQRSLEETGDRLVVFMNENDQFRVNHRFCKPYIGTSQDDIMRRASRGNKRMARAIKVGGQ